MNIILFEKEQNTQEIPRSSNIYQHIVKVLRLKEGDSFRAGIINGKKGLGKIEKLEKDNISVSLELDDDECGSSGAGVASVGTVGSEEFYPFTLICGSVRPPVAARVLKDATTMGVEKLCFVSSKLAEKSYFKSALWTSQKWRDALLEGASQAGTTGLPEVERFYSVKKAIDGVEADWKFFLSLSGQAQSLNEIDIAGFEKGKDKIVFAIGPERGWTEKEEALFLEAGYKPLSLGNRIYRTETAITAAINLLLLKFNYI